MSGRREPSCARRTLRAVERAVGEPLEQAVASPSGANVLAALTKLSTAGGDALQSIRGGVVHAGGLPSRRDLDELSARVARMGQLIEELAHRLDEHSE